MNINNRTKKNKTLFYALSILCLMAVLAAIISCFSNNDNSEPSETVSGAAEKSKYNFLLMGVDQSEKLADVIMLVSLDIKESTLAIAQIPRDTYAEYTTAAYRKLNGAISTLDDGRGVADFLEKAFGIKIDHHITVDLEGIAKTVDLLGGVEVNIPEDMTYVDSYQGLNIDLKAGRLKLDGDGAKQFIRYRSGYVRGDVARLDAQKIFLAALGEKIMSRGVTALIRPIITLMNESKSDLSITDCMFFVSNMTGIDQSKILFMTLPGADIKTENGTWYYIINKKETFRLVNEFFAEEDAPEFSEFDKDRLFTGTYSREFNSVYEAESGYEAEIISAEHINSQGIEIDRIEN